MDVLRPCEFNDDIEPDAEVAVRMDAGNHCLVCSAFTRLLEGDLSIAQEEACIACNGDICDDCAEEAVVNDTDEWVPL